MKDHDCPVCRDNLLDENHKLDSSSKLFSFFKAESKNKEQAFGGLSIPTENVVDHFSEVETLLRGKLEKALLGKRVTQKLLASIEGHIFVCPLQLCSSQLTKRIHLKYIEVRATSTVKWASSEARSVNIRKNKKLVKLNH